MKRRHAEMIRFGILIARHDWCTPLTAQQSMWLDDRGGAKSWHLNEALEKRAYERERKRLFHKSLKLINETLGEL